jgi:hypothetical protein
MGGVDLGAVVRHRQEGVNRYRDATHDTRHTHNQAGVNIQQKQERGVAG